MKILIVGLGALGTVFGCLLANDGHQVCALEPVATEELVRNRKVKICGIWGDSEATLDMIARSGRELDRTFDLVVLTVKSYDTGRALRDIAPSLSRETTVILAQNGLGNYETAAELVHPEQLVLARVIFGAETLAPGFSKVTVIADDVVIGSPEGLVPEEDLIDLARVLYQAGVPCRASAEVMKYIWGKVIYNSALNSLGAILEVNYGTLASLDPTRKMMEDVVAEAFAVLAATGQETFWQNAEEYLRDFYAKMVPPTADHHPSMLQDIQRGRRTEIDYLNGAICRLGARAGVATPANEAVTRLVKAKEELTLAGEPRQ